MVDILQLSIYLLATYQPFASPLYILVNIMHCAANITEMIFVAGLSNVFIGITKSISIRRIVQSFTAENTNVIFIIF